jgi:hypothetical protein
MQVEILSIMMSYAAHCAWVHGAMLAAVANGRQSFVAITYCVELALMFFMYPSG